MNPSNIKHLLLRHSRGWQTVIRISVGFMTTGMIGHTTATAANQLLIRIANDHCIVGTLYHTRENRRAYLLICLLHARNVDR